MAGEKTGRLWQAYATKTKPFKLLDELKHIKTFTPPQMTWGKQDVSSLSDGVVKRNIRTDKDGGTITITGEFRSDSTAYTDLKALETEDLFYVAGFHPVSPDVCVEYTVMLDSIAPTEVTRDGVLGWSATLSVLTEPIPFTKPLT